MDSEDGRRVAEMSVPGEGDGLVFRENVELRLGKGGIVALDDRSVVSAPDLELEGFLLALDLELLRAEVNEVFPGPIMEVFFVFPVYLLLV